MSGNHHLCPQAQATIIGHRGGFASHVRAPLGLDDPMPDRLNVADAGPLLCGGDHRLQPAGDVRQPPHRVGVIGIGGLGHMAVKFAAAYGCDVTALTSSQSKFDEARGFGATTSSPAGTSPHREARRHLRPADQHRERASSTGTRS
jgi:uncharacterized zinc-type alcohol dehydrogenase-like protein